LLTDQLGVACVDTHPLAQSTSAVRWSELQAHHLIRNSLSDALVGPEIQALTDRSILTAHNMISIVAMAEAGLGYTIIPETAVRGVGRGQLVFRPLADKRATREIHLLRRSGRPVSPAARMFETLLFDCL
jgi:DNA-binding transcriptional LysR family regulator